MIKSKTSSLLSSKSEKINFIIQPLDPTHLDCKQNSAFACYSKLVCSAASAATTQELV